MRKISSWSQLKQALPSKPERTKWKNTGGLLMPAAVVQTLLRNIRSGRIGNWDGVHAYYRKKSVSYGTDKFHHAWASLLEILKVTPARFTKKLFVQVLEQAVDTREWITRNILESRAKDYSNPFRQMVYDNAEEMEKVMGKLRENSFIRQQQEETDQFRTSVNDILQHFDK